ncbi:MAG: V-type ATP synthase subunit A, partial [Lachnospiraceae bacterium]|nr:V-type ATP synthase subunit A [Lachnospiraceae bacterium]
NGSRDALTKGASIEKLVAMDVREAIGRFKYTAEDHIDGEFDKINAELSKEIQQVLAEKEDF